MARILVIDDEEMVRLTIRQTLEKVGHTVMEAANGREGVDSYKAHGADLVVTDIIMPEQEGIETLITLRGMNDALPVIAMSGGGRIGTTDYLDIARRFGAVRVFEKPFNRKEFVLAVNEALAAAVA
ncbi:MAG: response regulator [Alphaproteobacteria bacterium]|nr:response regulator [Alphaproteobacteria bacterium]